MRVFLIFCLVWLVFYISACSSSPEQALPGPSLSQIDAEILPPQDSAVPSISTDQLLYEYRQLLASVDDAELKRNVQSRLADLELRASEDLLVEGQFEEAPFAAAISIYQELIPTAKTAQERTRLQYQLSKAYALAGRNEESSLVMSEMAAAADRGDDSDRMAAAIEEPQVKLLLESHFRLAETAFNQGRYQQAKIQYQQVLRNQNPSDFEQNAHYMLGWTEFKLNRYDLALDSFVEVLDQLLGAESAATAATELDELSKSEQNLVSDSLRAMSIAFSYLGGAESITETLVSKGDRSYSDLLYSELGGLYRSQQRYRDAADTYLAYVDYAPFSAKAPAFSELAIQTYYEGNFPSLILPAKQSFVLAYGLDSPFWQAQQPEGLELLKPYLHEYLQELSSHYHALAQTYVAVDEPSEDSEQDRVDAYRENLLLAADYYHEFVSTFPTDVKTPQLAFFRAEALFDATEYEGAADAYEFVAYQLGAESRRFGQVGEHDEVAENGEPGYHMQSTDRHDSTEISNSEIANSAAYNLILAIDQVLASTDLGTSVSMQAPQGQEPVAQPYSGWQKRKIDSSIGFVDSYPGDARAPAVLAQVMDIHFRNELYADAIILAERLRNWQPAVDAELSQHATMIAAQSEFVLQQYFASEILYRQLLEQLPAGDSRIADAEQQIAASLYRQAESLLASDNKSDSVDKFLAAADFLPDSDIAPVARFDAANILMETESWSNSIEQFLLLAQRYPQHRLSVEIPAKLAFLYQQTEQWHLAADSILVMMEQGDMEEQFEDTGESRAQTLYLAAQLYQQAGSDADAKRVYQRYINSYPEPALLRMEAQYQLTLMSQGTERNRLINALADAQSPGAGSDRELYLSAWATNELADQTYQNYRTKQLSLPLQKSLKAKQLALGETLDAYQRVLDFGIAEFATQASFRMAEVYAGLSQAMMDSERPDDLDALALEQYEILLEEQAYPFEEKAIELHETNAQRSWEGLYDLWVQQSFTSLGTLLPGRYNKVEKRAEVSLGIH